MALLSARIALVIAKHDDKTSDATVSKFNFKTPVPQRVSRPTSSGAFAVVKDIPRTHIEGLSAMQKRVTALEQGHTTLRQDQSTFLDEYAVLKNDHTMLMSDHKVFSGDLVALNEIVTATNMTQDAWTLRIGLASLRVAAIRRLKVEVSGTSDGNISAITNNILRAGDYSRLSNPKAAHDEWAIWPRHCITDDDEAAKYARELQETDIELNVAALMAFIGVIAIATTDYSYHHYHKSITRAHPSPSTPSLPISAVLAMCYEFVLHVGCGHDHSLLYYRPLPQTPKCLCKTFKRLPAHPGVCPDCDRTVKMSRNQPVPPDPLTPENRAKAQLWRARLDAEVKDREAKRAAKERKDKEIGITDEKQAAFRSKRNSEAAHKQRYNSRQKQQGLIDGVIPPFVPQPGETFVQHITAEVVDDAKSGGEMTRLLQALETGVQGYGWIGDWGQESWLMFSKEWMEKNFNTMNIWTGKLGEPGMDAMVIGGPGYDHFFPALGKPTIGNPDIGIPMMPEVNVAPYWGRNNTAPVRPGPGLLGPGPGGLLQPQPSWERLKVQYPHLGKPSTPAIEEKENRSQNTVFAMETGGNAIAAVVTPESKKVSYAIATAGHGGSPATLSTVGPNAKIESHH
ncbi:hypothetical protein Dda_9267 [Drechslerella dactyloides]|uniref:Uncharacterized protein n=1 Tax=Drechslerella dactyloides TaxID=74499 RepID=A0AAD6IPI8_DREDA|nr:hypothetical protein Dda_9267 [Drechslerella dactyloides]